MYHQPQTAARRPDPTLRRAEPKMEDAIVLTAVVVTAFGTLGLVLKKVYQATR